MGTTPHAREPPPAAASRKLLDRIATPAATTGRVAAGSDTPSTKRRVVFVYGIATQPRVAPTRRNSVYRRTVSVYNDPMATHVRKNITLPRSLDDRLRKVARKRGTTQSGLIVHLVETGLAAEASQVDRLLSFVGVIQGPPDLSETIDETVYGG